jgi:uncharacterized membrane protein
VSETGRLETLSDGVFAIAATLLVLDVHEGPGGDLAHGLLHAWPAYLAYVISFLTIGIMWINHHAVFRQIGRVDRTFLALNVVFLMVIAFLPFPTRVLAAHLHHDATTATVFYGLANVGMAVTYTALWFYAARGRRLLAVDANEREVRGITRSFLPGIPLYTLATVSAFLSSWLAVGIFGGLAAFYLLESSLLARR